MTAILFYDVVTAVHVLGVVVAFGITFAYPLLLRWVKGRHPHAMPALHGAQDMLGKRIVTPGMVVVLVAGIYLASDRDLWDRVWVSVPMLILIVLFGLGGAFFAPQERKLAELSQRDLASGSEPGTVRFSAEYEALYQRVYTVGLVAAGLVAVAVFFMVAKPGGYA